MGTTEVDGKAEDGYTSIKFTLAVSRAMSLARWLSLRDMGAKRSVIYLKEEPLPTNRFW